MNADSLQINLKEGWLRLEMIYSSGEEAWEFFKTRPYAEDVYISHGDNKHEYIEGRVKRIMYVEVAED